jgi:peptide/nickel transport system permease protein
MRQYILRRIITMIPVLFIVSIISFSLLYLLPGDPALAMMGEDAGNEEQYQALREQLGLDDPIYVQYANWAWSVLQGDLGRSVRTNEPVIEMLASRIPITLYYGIAAMFIGVGIALPVAMVSALKPGSRFDVIGTVGAMAGVAIPNFWLAILLMWVFAVQLNWLPASGYVSPFEDPVRSLERLIMPAIALGTAWSAIFMRQARSSLIEVLQQDYIQTARAKGLAQRAVVVRHAMKNAMIPVVTVMGVQIGNILSGAIITETVFAVPGVGRITVDAIWFRDFTLLQGAVLMMTLAVLVANLLTDILYGYLDPRIRYS